jgi:Cu2+-exporting ATPase
VLKTHGAAVFAGTINQKGSLRFKAEKVGAATLLAQIISKVQEAQGSKAPVQKLVDKIAGIFVPVVIGIALLTFFTWLVLGGDNAFTHALITSVTVLVIACPCALGLATPTAIMVAMGKGAENNILIKDAESLEQAHRVNAVILDKTGTITEGKPVVTDISWQTTDPEQAAVLYTLEQQSEHPFGEAIVQHLQQNKIRPISVHAFESIVGKGVTGSYKGTRYMAGNSSLLAAHGIAVKATENAVYFANEQQVLATIYIADTIKPGSKEAIDTLQKRGIEVYMLTGDSEQTAAAVAREVGITKYKAAVLPAYKAEFAKELQRQGKVVAMVGDGINDSQALAQADVSIAMGRGSDIAMDVAKMTLISSDLRSIPKALQLSKRTVRTIRQNLFWAFIYNIIGIPLAAGVLYPVNGFLLNPMIAGAAMALSSVSVVANSLRLKISNL